MVFFAKTCSFSHFLRKKENISAAATKWSHVIMRWRNNPKLRREMRQNQRGVFFLLLSRHKEFWPRKFLWQKHWWSKVYSEKPCLSQRRFTFGLTTPGSCSATSWHLVNSFWAPRPSLEMTPCICWSGTSCWRERGRVTGGTSVKTEYFLVDHEKSVANYLYLNLVCIKKGKQLSCCSATNELWKFYVKFENFWEIFKISDRNFAETELSKSFTASKKQNHTRTGAWAHSLLGWDFSVEKFTKSN